MTATLQTTPRPRLGSRAARILRLQGRIPISLQGEGKEALHLSIDEHTFLAARRHHNIAAVLGQREHAAHPFRGGNVSGRSRAG